MQNLEKELEDCCFREIDNNVYIAERVVLCNSNDVYCKLRGDTIIYKGKLRKTCTFSETKQKN